MFSTKDNVLFWFGLVFFLGTFIQFKVENQGLRSYSQDKSVSFPYGNLTLPL